VKEAQAIRLSYFKTTCPINGAMPTCHASCRNSEKGWFNSVSSSRSTAIHSYAALFSSKFLEGAALKVCKVAPHGMYTSHNSQVNEDLLACIKGEGPRA